MPGDAVGIIAAIVDQGIAPFLAGVGFSRRGKTFHRPFAHGLELVNVQSSRWNSGRSAEFTLNLCAHYPVADALAAGTPLEALEGRRGKRIPVPSLATWCYPQRRIHWPPTDASHWWKVDETSDAREVAADVVDKLTRFGIPWIERHADADFLLAYYVRNESHDSAAILHLALGDQTAARLQLDQHVRRFPGTADRLTGWAHTIGLAWTAS